MSDAFRALAPVLPRGGTRHRHLPYVRRVRTGWHVDEHRQVVAESWNDTEWDVICRECGDTEGPTEDQAVDVQKLRGPYSRKHKARREAHRHERKQGFTGIALL